LTFLELANWEIAYPAASGTNLESAKDSGHHLVSCLAGPSRSGRLNAGAVENSCTSRPADMGRLPLAPVKPALQCRTRRFPMPIQGCVAENCHESCGRAAKRERRPLSRGRSHSRRGPVSGMPRSGRHLITAPVCPPPRIQMVGRSVTLTGALRHCQGDDRRVQTGRTPIS
jgi:hypothetical protein